MKKKAKQRPQVSVALYDKATGRINSVARTPDPKKIIPGPGEGVVVSADRISPRLHCVVDGEVSPRPSKAAATSETEEGNLILTLPEGAICITPQRLTRDDSGRLVAKRGKEPHKIKFDHPDCHIPDVVIPAAD